MECTLNLLEGNDFCLPESMAKEHIFPNDYNILDYKDDSNLPEDIKKEISNIVLQQINTNKENCNYTYNMKTNKRALYESVMKEVSKTCCLTVFEISFITLSYNRFLLFVVIL